MSDFFRFLSEHHPNRVAHLTRPSGRNSTTGIVKIPEPNFVVAGELVVENPPAVKTRYEVRVRGRVSDLLLAELGVEEETTVTTSMIVEVSDEAALHGLLRRVEALGIELVSIQEAI